MTRTKRRKLIALLVIALTGLFITAVKVMELWAIWPEYSILQDWPQNGDVAIMQDEPITSGRFKDESYYTEAIIPSLLYGISRQRTLSFTRGSLQVTVRVDDQGGDFVQVASRLDNETQFWTWYSRKGWGDYVIDRESTSAVFKIKDGKVSRLGSGTLSGVPTSTTLAILDFLAKTPPRMSVQKRVTMLVPVAQPLHGRETKLDKAELMRYYPVVEAILAETKEKLAMFESITVAFPGVTC